MMERKTFDAIVLTNHGTYFKGMATGEVKNGNLAPPNTWILGIDTEAHPYITREKLVGTQDILVDLSHQYENPNWDGEYTQDLT